jgi:hypothetical protein
MLSIQIGFPVSLLLEDHPDDPEVVVWPEAVDFVSDKVEGCIDAGISSLVDSSALKFLLLKYFLIQ